MHGDEDGNENDYETDTTTTATTTHGHDLIRTTSVFTSGWTSDFDSTTGSLAEWNGPEIKNNCAFINGTEGPFVFSEADSMAAW